MDELAVFKAFGKGEKKHGIAGEKNCVVYTRVSSATQLNNTSLETQRKACIEFAQRHGYAILKNFGQTSESAKTDNERAEFTAMINFVKKSKERVSKILVYSLDRFSRNQNAIWLSGQLRTLGINIISVTQAIDTSNPAGVLQESIVMIFNQFDLEIRKAKCNAGILAMVRNGGWPMRPPLGYDSIVKNSRRTIVPNATGQLLRQAFEWKAYENITDEEIRVRLSAYGVSLCHQRIGKILRNPFYAGIIAHRMLDGETVKGNHEGIVSKELFLRVNGILQEGTHGYTVKEENERVPLKRFLLCGQCNQPMRGYEVKRKSIFYYKCGTKGCGVNKNANMLHERFADILQYFTLDFFPDTLKLLKQQVIATFNQYSQSHDNQLALLQNTVVELQKKIARLEERLIAEEIPSELYYKYSAVYNEERETAEQTLLEASQKKSNLGQCIDMAIDFAVNLPIRWRNADYNTKQRVQKMLFPFGVSYDKKNDVCRTEKINSIFLHFAHLKQVIKEEKRGIPELSMEFARLVARRGIEPLFLE